MYQNRVLKDTNRGPHKDPDMPIDIPNYLKTIDISILVYISWNLGTMVHTLHFSSLPLIFLPPTQMATKL